MRGGTGRIVGTYDSVVNAWSDGRESSAPTGCVVSSPSQWRSHVADDKSLSIFPDQVHIGDRFTDAETGDEPHEWEVVSRPVTFKKGHEVRARVQRPGDPGTAVRHVDGGLRMKMSIFSSSDQSQYCSNRWP